MRFQTIDLAFNREIATITLNRPEMMNGLNATMRREIVAALAEAAGAARVIVLTGAGRGFCSGQDLSEAPGPDEIEAVLRDEYAPMLRALADCPIPTIAAVNGAAAGAGASLALAADLVIAAKSAMFIQAFARIGLIPDAGGSYWLPRQIGTARAMGAALLAEPIPAEQAEAWGMIWQSVPDADFATTVAAKAAALAAGPTLAYRLIKQALRASPENGRDAQFALEAQLQAIAGQSADFAEGLAAFRDKRPPSFVGR